MKKRYCINVDQCIVVPTIGPIMWTIALLLLFLFVLLIEGSKDMAAFIDARSGGWRLWFYLSGPISLVASFLVSVAFILFPVSYIELQEEGARLHKAFKTDQFLRYEDFLYVRLNPKRRKEWAMVYFFLAEGSEVNTVDIRKKPPHGRVWLSCFACVYRALASKVKAAPSPDGEWEERDNFVANVRWIAENGSPDSQEWNGMR